MTPGEILAIWQAGPEAVIDLVQSLLKRIRFLEDQLAQNSRNSSKPPSSDGLKKPALKQRRRSSGRKVGGQKGHEGHTLRMVKNPDHTESYTVDACKHCGCSLKNVEPIGRERRQEFDIPPIRLEVTEHRAEIKNCPTCGKQTKATFPESIRQPVQYGNRLKSIAVYLNSYQLLPYERMSELFQDVFSHSLSKATLVNANNTCYQRLESAEEAIREQLVHSSAVHFDETGCRINGKRDWFHVASTPYLTYYAAHERRGKEAMDEINILPHFRGTAQHDDWKPYFRYNCKHALCNAHHLRELIFIYEEHHQDWAQQMIDCLLDIKKAVEDRKRLAKSLRPEIIKRFERRYDRIIRKGLKENRTAIQPRLRNRRGRQKQSKAKNLLDRLKDHKKEVLAFMYDFRVDFDNNLGERDIRMTKVQQKISGSFRSHNGSKSFCRIRGYISTARKNGVNALEALQKALNGNPFIPSIKDCRNRLLARKRTNRSPPQ